MKFVSPMENIILLTKEVFSFTVLIIFSKRYLLIIPGSRSTVPKLGVLQRH